MLIMSCRKKQLASQHFSVSQKFVRNSVCLVLACLRYGICFVCKQGTRSTMKLICVSFVYRY